MASYGNLFYVVSEEDGLYQFDFTSTTNLKLDKLISWKYFEDNCDTMDVT